MGIERRIPSPLTVGFVYTGVVADGDALTPNGTGGVRRLVDPSEPYVGQVYTFETGIKELVAVVPHNYHRNVRIAGAAVVPGKFVWGLGSTVKQYSPAIPARHDGTTTGPKTVVLDTSDKVKVKLQYGSSQTVTLTAGVGLTFAAIAEELNAGLTGITAEVDAAGNLNLVADEIWKSIEVEAVTHDAYTLLGWTAAVYPPSAPSHDASAVGGIILTAGDQGDPVVTLEY
jgi:hypothetical protein